MEKQYIAVIDSGIGGLSVLNNLVKSFPYENFLYYGDNNNAPYGNKSKNELLSLTMKSIDIIKKCNVKIIVLGCNTLSVNLFDDIKIYSSLPVIPIFPPVESEIMSGKKVLLLSTRRTYEQYKKYKIKNFHAVGLINTADKIEKNLFDLKNLDFDYELRHGHIGEFNDQKGYYDRVILGCTHYNFIKNEIIDHFQPQKTITGDHFLIKELSKHIKSTKSSVKYKHNEILFIGENKEINQIIYNKYYDFF